MEKVIDGKRIEAHSGRMKKRRSTINIQIGRHLRRERERIGLTQLAVAKSVGILRTSLINIEQGRQNVTLAMLLKFAAAYGVPLETLVKGMYEKAQGGKQ